LASFGVLSCPFFSIVNGIRLWVALYAVYISIEEILFRFDRKLSFFFSTLFLPLPGLPPFFRRISSPFLKAFSDV